MSVRAVPESKRRSASSRVGVLLCTVALIGCTTPGPDVPRTTPQLEELRIGFPEAYPGTGRGTNEFARMMTSESLTVMRIDGRAAASLAEKWSWENDNLRLRVTLQKDLRLDDGRTFAGDVAADITRQLVQNTDNLEQYPALRDVKEVRAEGLDLVFELRRPSALLPEDLAFPLNMAGPYRRLDKPDKEAPKTLPMHFARFDDYYQGKPAIAKITVTPYDALRTTWASLLRGDLDMVSDIPADAVEFVSDEAVQIITYPRWYQFAVMLNLKNPALRSARVRKALNLAIDRDSILKLALRGHGQPSTGPIWPRYWAYDASVQGYSFDPRAASLLLDQQIGARLSPGRDETLPPARLRFTCLVLDTFAVQRRIALHVQRDLLRIGVDMQIKAVPIDEYNALIREGQFDAILLDQISGPTPGRPYVFFGSRSRFESSLNVLGYENPQAEALFTSILTSLDEPTVRSATSGLQRVLLEDPPAIFLVWNERARAIRRNVHVPMATDQDPMRTLPRWTAASSAPPAQP